MTQPQADPGSGLPILAQIRNGMQVFDQHGVAIGRVERVHVGLPTDRQAAGDTTEIKAIEQALFGSDRLPEMLRTRLLERGFMRVESPKLQATDRYIMPEQIERIADDRVYLCVPAERTVQQ